MAERRFMVEVTVRDGWRQPMVVPEGSAIACDDCGAVLVPGGYFWGDDERACCTACMLKSSNPRFFARGRMAVETVYAATTVPPVSDATRQMIDRGEAEVDRALAAFGMRRSGG